MTVRREAALGADRKQRPDVQRVGRRIVAAVHRGRAAIESSAKPVEVAAGVEQPAGGKVVEEGRANGSHVTQSRTSRSRSDPDGELAESQFHPVGEGGVGGRT